MKGGLHNEIAQSAGKDQGNPRYLSRAIRSGHSRGYEWTFAAFKERAQNENARLLDATDSEFWFSVCFQTREQKEEFLKKAGLFDIGDKYIDGLKVAAKMGINLESPVPPNRKIVKFGGAYLNRIIK